MARIQPVLSAAELALVDQMAKKSHSKPELAILEGKGNRVSPKELALLAEDLTAAKDHSEAAHLREQLMRGFYGI
jgi:hypothetical protein